MRWIWNLLPRDKVDWHPPKEVEDFFHYVLILAKCRNFVIPVCTNTGVWWVFFSTSRKNCFNQKSGIILTLAGGKWVNVKNLIVPCHINAQKSMQNQNPDFWMVGHIWTDFYSAILRPSLLVLPTNLFAKHFKEIQWTLVIVNSVLSPILFTNERCLLFSM